MLFFFHPSLLTVIISALVVAIIIMVIFYSVGKIEKGKKVRFYTVLQKIMATLLMLSFLNILCMIISIGISANNNDTVNTNHSMDEFGIDLKLIETTSIFSNFTAYVWPTSIKEINKSDDEKEKLKKYKDFCAYKGSIICFIELKEYPGNYYDVQKSMNLQLNNEYDVSVDAIIFDKNIFKTMKQNQESHKNSLLKDLNDNGFVVENYGFYKEEDLISLILERPLEDEEYKKLMTIFKKWINESTFDLHLKSEQDSFKEEVIIYNDLKKEVNKF